MKRIAAAIVLLIWLSAAAHAEAPAVRLDILKLALESVPSIPEPRKQARALLAIAKAYDKAGKRSDAIAIIQRASAATALIDDGGLKGTYQSLIFEAQCAFGDFAGALKRLDLVDRGIPQVRVLNSIASAQLAAGDRSGARSILAQAVDSARFVDNKSRRVELLAGISIAQVDAEDRNGAAGTLELVLAANASDDGKLPDAFVLSDIAAAQTKLGDRDGAAETLRQAIVSAEANRDPVECCYSLIEIARVQSLMGGQDSAKETLLLSRVKASEIADHSKRAQQLAFIAEGLRSAGARVESAETFELARAAAKLIDDSSSRDLRLSLLAAAQAGVQYEKVVEPFGEAMGIALALLGGKSGASGEVLGIQQVPADDLDSALATAIEIRDPPIRFEAIMVVAAPALVTGDIESLQTLAEEGRKSIGAMEAEKAGSSYLALHDLALLYIAAGVVELPLFMGRKMAVAGTPAYLLAYVGWAQAEMGDLVAAKSTLAEIPENRSPAAPFGPDLFPRLLALAQANAGEIEAAMATLGTVSDPSIKVEILVAIAVDRPPPAFWAQIHADFLDYP